MMRLNLEQDIHSLGAEEDRECNKIQLMLPEIDGTYVMDEIYINNNLLEENELLTFQEITLKKIPIIKIKNVDTNETEVLRLYLGFSNNIYLKDYSIDSIFGTLIYSNESSTDGDIYSINSQKVINKDDPLVTLSSIQFNSEDGVSHERLIKRKDNNDYSLKAEEYSKISNIKEENGNRFNNNVDKLTNIIKKKPSSNEKVVHDKVKFCLLLENHNIYNYKSDKNEEDPDYFYHKKSENYYDVLNISAITDISKIRDYRDLKQDILDIIKNTLSNSGGFTLEKIHDVANKYIKNYERILECFYIKDFFDINKHLIINYYLSDNLKNISVNKFDEYYLAIVNNPIKYLVHLIDRYETFLEDDNIKGITPDIYMLCGVEEFPIYYEEVMTRDFRRQYEPKCDKLINFSNHFFKVFKHSSLWYYINLLVCLSAQIIAPIYYIYDYHRINNNFCPNNSGYDLKLFGVVFFLTLYSQYNDMQENLFKSQFKYSQTYFIKTRTWLIFSYFVNQVVTLLIPLVTYVLFLDDPTILGFILNCVTATFLIQLDNMIAGAGTGTGLLEQFSTDCMYIEYISRGVVEKNFVNKVYNSPFLSAITTIASMLQVALMFFLTIQIGVCL